MIKTIFKKILIFFISICLLLPTILLTSNNVSSEEQESNEYLYIFREGESWDHSYDNYTGLNWLNKNWGDISEDASDGSYAYAQSIEGTGDYAEWDFNVHHAGTYKIWVRGYHIGSWDICTNISLEWNGSQVGSTQNWKEYIIGRWEWTYFGNVTCVADTLATIRIKSLDEGWVPVDKLLITNDTGYNPSGVEDDVGSFTHDIGERIPYWLDDIYDLNYDFIYNKTKSLSRVILDSYDEDVEIAKGRAFGTLGEQDAANKLTDWFKEEIGIHTARERLIAYPGKGINDKMEIKALGLIINNNGTEQKIDQVFMGVNSSRNHFFKLDSSDNGNYTCTNIKVRNWYEAHKQDRSFPDIFDANFTTFLNNKAEEILNETLYIVQTTNATFQGTLFNMTLKYYEEYHDISFSNPDKNNSDNWNTTLLGYNRSTEEPYVWIIEDPWNNPNPSITFPAKVDFLYNILLGGKNYLVEDYFSKFFLLTYLIRIITSFGYDNCKGIILYDFNNNTHNMVKTQVFSHPFKENPVYNPDCILPLMGLPLIFINGTTGQMINESYEYYNISFYRDQSYNDSVNSYNIIGTIYGVEQNKTIILSSLYDSWWNQGTTDSAIGMSIVLAIAKYYKENKIIPRYNLKFICFSGEEYGYLGAKSYEARHKDEEILAIIDLNQLGFEERYDIPLNFTMYVNNETVNESLYPIVERSDYENRTFHHANFTTYISANGGPSNDRPFATKRNESGIQTVCFLKDTGWTLHHRDGKNQTNNPHTDGDVLSYYNETYVRVVAEMVLNVTRYLTEESIVLGENWNMITIPYKNNWNASDLVTNLSNCTSVVKWNPSEQSYWIYLPDYPAFDFELKPGNAYYVEMNKTDLLGMNGTPVTDNDVNISLEIGWNLIGWYKDSSIMASELADKLNGCTMIAKYNPVEQSYWIYLPGYPLFDFPISKYMGIFALINESGGWYGNGTSEESGEDSSDGGKQGNQSNTPSMPYPIYGKAYYRNLTNPADNANIMLINLNTSESLNTSINANYTGCYIIDLGQLNQTINNNDTLRIIINGTGNYSGWTSQKDIKLNTSMPGERVPDIFINPSNISLLTGWNLITVPVNNTWNASNLAENITGCQTITCWDPGNQTYHSYIKDGPEGFDFSIDDGKGYYINVNQTSVLSWLDSGEPITNASINYVTGWNLIGWYNDSSINASSLSDSLEPDQYVLSITRWNSGNQTYHNFTVGDPPGKDFEIIKGMGVVVDIHNTSGGGGGSNPGIPHTIWGYAYYSDSNIHANNANVVIHNKETSEQIYTVVGESASGCYMQELCNLPSGWSDEDIITITVDSTSEDIYEGWAGYIEITANNSVGNQKIQNIMVYGEDSTVIRYDNGSEESTVILDNSTDEVLKTLIVDSEYLETASSAKLWIYAKADGEDMENSSHRITVNNDSKCVIFFDPIATFGYSYSWQSFNIELEWLTSDSNTFSVVDAYTSEQINDLKVGIDTENDCDMSQWKETSGSLPPADECEGELLMVLQLFYE